MRHVIFENRPDRKAQSYYRSACAFVVAGLALALCVELAEAENKIFLRCESGGTYITQGDMTAESIGEELASLSSDPIAHSSFSLVLSYQESGQSTSTHAGPGVFQHSGLTVVRPVASSSPEFWLAMERGDVWAKCELHFTRQSSPSTHERYLEITLETVVVTKIESRDVAQLEAPGTGRSQLEAITFSFRKIHWASFNGQSYRYDSEVGP